MFIKIFYAKKYPKKIHKNEGHFFEGDDGINPKNTQNKRDINRFCKKINKNTGWMAHFEDYNFFVENFR